MIAQIASKIFAVSKVISRLYDFAWVAILLAHGYPLQDSLFEFASAIGTVGLSVGLTAADSPPLVLWTESIGMFIGRLEIYVFFVAVIKLYKDAKHGLER